MKDEYKKAFNEVIQIINLMPKELKDKIPSKFIEILENEKEKDYNKVIKEPIEKEKLLEETVIILSIIYRDFLSPIEERKELQKQDLLELKEFEEKLQEKYSIERIFEEKKRTNINKNIQNNNETKDLVIYKDKWYKKIWNIIKGVFGK